MVKTVFSSVAHNYDVMNDLMSAGKHRYRSQKPIISLGSMVATVLTIQKKNNLLYVCTAPSRYFGSVSTVLLNTRVVNSQQLLFVGLLLALSTSTPVIDLLLL